jgi:MFS family permease
MFRLAAHHFPSYFHKRLTRRMGGLYLAATMLDFALAMVVLFEPVYLYHLGYSIQHILLYYVVVYGVYYFIVPLGGMFVARFGPARSMAISSVMLIGYYLSLLLVANTPIFFWIAPLFFALQKMWYWPAYHMDFILSSDTNERGKEFSGLWSLSTIVYIIGPILGGVIIQQSGFTVLFSVVMLLILLSNLPLFLTPMSYHGQLISYWKMLIQPFTRYHIRSTISYLALGEELIVLTVWPIFIALTFASYEKMGGAIAVATFITALVTLYIGKLIDTNQPKKTMRIGAILSVLMWVIRPFIKTVGLVFTSDTLGRIAKNTTFVTLTTASYSKALREKQIIERSVLFEQGFAVGKTLIAAAIIILSSYVSPFSASFFAAAAVSLLYLVFAIR